MRILAQLVLAISLAAAATGSALAERIAVIGTGEVAGAVGPLFAAQGHEIVYGSRDPDREAVRALVERTGAGASATTQRGAADGADIVVLAVPWNVVETVVGNLGSLDGKIVLDPTNPRLIGDDGLRDWARDTSNAEIIQRLAPNAHVVKALNTMNWRTMVDPASTGGPVSVPIVGDDEAAKAAVAALVEGMGLKPIDLGPLRYARIVEGMYLLWGNANTLGRGFNYYLRPAP